MREAFDFAEGGCRFRRELLRVQQLQLRFGKEGRQGIRQIMPKLSEALVRRVCHALCYSTIER
jgi:hypothetical protein